MLRSYAARLVALADPRLAGNGGSNGATMRFAPEANHGANAGLEHARNHLEKIKKQFPEITYSDLWVRRLPSPRRLCSASGNAH